MKYIELIMETLDSNPEIADQILLDTISGILLKSHTDLLTKEQYLALIQGLHKEIDE